MKLGIAGPIQTMAFRKYLNHLPSHVQIPQGLGGTPVNQLALALLEQGYQLTIFTLDFSVSKEVVLEGPKIKICIGPYRSRGRGRDLFRAERNYLREVIEREKPDIVHAQWTYEYALGALASGLPTIVTAHDAPLRALRFMPSPYWFMRTLMSIKAAHQTQHLTAVSPYIAGHFKRVLRYPRQIRVIPNGLQSDLFEMGKKRTREKKDVLTFATVLNYWGRLKNGKVALEAFKQVHETMPQTRLLMFGEGHGEGENASIWARERGLSKGVSFIGALPYEKLMRLLVNKVDVLVHPSVEEAFSMAVAEAIAIGIPVIGGIKSGGVPFILDEGNLGLLVDVRSPVNVAEAMLHLARDSALRSKLAQSAKESAQRRFHITKISNAYIEAYEEVLAGVRR